MIVVYVHMYLYIQSRININRTLNVV